MLMPRLNRWRFAILISTLILAPLAGGWWWTILGYANPTSQFFEIYKSTVVRTGTMLAALLWCLEWLLTPKPRFQDLAKTTWVQWVIPAFLVSAIISTLLSPLPIISWWGNDDRWQGLLNWSCYLVFAFLLWQSVTTEKRRQIVFMTISLTGVVTALLAIWQRLADPWAPYLSTELFQGRLYSTLGHPNFFAYYLLFTISVTLILLLHTRRSRPLWASALLLQVVVLIFTGSRGGLLGLAVFGGGVLAYLWWQKRAWWKLGLFTLITLLAISAVSFLGQWSLTEQRSLTSRTLIWQDVTGLIVQRPWFGYGFDTLPWFFPTQKSVELLNYENMNMNADRAHNIVLDLSYNTGLVGLTLWLIILILTIHHGIFRRPHPTAPFLAISLLAYTVALWFGFNVTVHELLWWSIVALILAPNHEHPLAWPAGARRWIMLLPTGALFAGLILANWNILVADIYYQKGQVTNDYRYLEQADRIFPFSPTYKFALAQAFSALNRPPKAWTYLEEGGALTNQWDLRYYRLRGQWLQDFSNSPTWANNYQLALQLAPLDKSLYRAYAAALIKAHRPTDAHQLLARYLAVAPTYWLWDTYVLSLDPYSQQKYRLFFQENKDFRELLRWYDDTRPGGPAVRFATHRSSALEYSNIAAILEREGLDLKANYYRSACLNVAEAGENCAMLNSTP